MNEVKFEEYREKFQKLMGSMRIAELRSMRGSLEVLSEMTNLQRLLIISDLFTAEFRKTNDPFKDEFHKIIEENF